MCTPSCGSWRAHRASRHTLGSLRVRAARLPDARRRVTRMTSGAQSSTRSSLACARPSESARVRKSGGREGAPFVLRGLPTGACRLRACARDHERAQDDWDALCSFPAKAMTRYHDLVEVRIRRVKPLAGDDLFRGLHWRTMCAPQEVCCGSPTRSLNYLNIRNAPAPPRAHEPRTYSSTAACLLAPAHIQSPPAPARTHTLTQNTHRAEDVDPDGHEDGRTCCMPVLTAAAMLRASRAARKW